jgi:hypothetical protein
MSAARRLTAIVACPADSKSPPLTRVIEHGHGHGLESSSVVTDDRRPSLNRDELPASRDVGLSVEPAPRPFPPGPRKLVRPGPDSVVFNSHRRRSTIEQPAIIATVCMYIMCHSDIPSNLSESLNGLRVGSEAAHDSPSRVTQCARGACHGPWY